MPNGPERREGATDDDVAQSRPLASSPTGTLADDPAAAARPKPDLLSADLPIVPLDRYRIEAEHARGGLGRILRATDTRLDRIVAIKELSRDNPVARARFAREIRLTAKLQHPNIIPIHEAGRWPTGQYFYAMKFVEGQTLAQAIGHAGTAEARYALLPSMLGVAEAMAYAHSQRIIHRDLKPMNVLVGPFGETVVIDWGLAKEVGVEEDVEELPADRETPFETRHGAILGTPAYMPPEQAGGQALDETADVYALGAILYHLIAGRSPYADHSPEDVLKHVLEEPPQPLDEIDPDAPPELVAIVTKAMARDPRQRYRTAREMAEELARYTTGRLVTAYRYTLMDLARRFVRRHRAPLMTATAALVALIAFGAASVVRVAQERDRAEKSAKAEALARRNTERRVDELLVEKARALVDRDPTGAIAWLKRLTSIPRGAATVAALAEDRGVATRIFRDHRDLITAVAFTPDGRTLITASHDKTVLLHDVATGRATVIAQHADRVTSVDVSADGRFVASAGYDGVVRVYDQVTKNSRELREHAGAVKYIAFSPTGDRLASVSSDGTVGFWNASTLKGIRQAAQADRDLFGAFSPDGTSFVSGSHGGALKIWRADGTMDRVLTGHQGPVKSAAWTPNGKMIVSGGQDGTVRSWSVKDGKEKVIFSDPSAVQALALSHDGTKLAIATMDGKVRLGALDNPSFRVVGVHAERVSAVMFSRDGRYLASCGWDKTIRLVDLDSNANAVLLGHADIVDALAFDQNGTELASGSWDKTVRLWKLPLRDMSRVLSGHSVGVHAVAFSPDGKQLASAGHDDTVRLWADGRQQKVFQGHTDHVYRVVFSPDGRLIASSSDDQTVRLWPVDGSAPRVLQGHAADVEELAFSPDGTLLASASEDHTVRIWPIAGGAPRVLLHPRDVTALAFDRTGGHLATAARDGAVRIWSVSDGRLEREVGRHDDEVWGLTRSRDDRLIASAGADNRVILWNLVDGTRRTFEGLAGARQVVFAPDARRFAVAGVAPLLWICTVAENRCEQLVGHSSLVRDLAFVSDGSALVTTGGDGTVQIWDVETLERRVLEGHAAPVFDLDVDASGRWVASAGGDGAVRMWPIRLPPKPQSLRGMLDAVTAERAPETSLDATD